MLDSEIATVASADAEKTPDEHRTLRSGAHKKRRFLNVVVVYGALAILALAFPLTNVDQGAVNLWLIYSMIAVGFYFIFALAGQFALSQGFFALIGGFTSAWVTTSHSFIIGVASGVLVSAGLALVFALVMLRVTGFYLAIASLGLTQIGTIVISKWPALGGTDGTRVGIPPAELFGHVFRRQDEVFWLLFGGVVLVMLLAACLESSPVRRELIAVQHKPVVAPTLGIRLPLVRISAYVTGSICAAFAGALFAHWQGFMSVDAFGIELSIMVFVMVLFGGLQSVWGAVVGAAFYVWVPFTFTALGSYQDVFFGGLIVVIIIFFPEGLTGIADKVIRLVRGKVSGGRWAKDVAL